MKILSNGKLYSQEKNDLVSDKKTPNIALFSFLK
jgi:hypothetical protein